MKKTRRFTWCVCYYNVMSGDVTYRVYVDLTIRQINQEVLDFIDSNDGYVVRIFKNYKVF